MELDRIFGNHMVIQRNRPFVIWGTGEDKEKIRIRIGENTAETTVKNGKWKAEIPPMEAAKGLTLTAESDSRTVVLEDVAVGEVWLAGGQSNMEFFMRFDSGYEEEKNGCFNPDLRFFDYPEVSYPEQEQDFDYSQMGYWRTCTPENLKYYSAVAYYFQKRLQQDLNVPVGIIGCNWGGTTASCWMADEYLKRSGSVWLDEYEAQVCQINDMEAYSTAFRSNPMNDKGRPFEDPFLLKMLSVTTREEQIEMMQNISGDFLPPAGPLDPNRPCGLYHTMLEHVAPYSIRGVIWYQGESDRIHGDIYKKVFLDMVECWRELWGEQLPFLTVQLAPFEAWLDQTGEGFPQIREQQRMAAEEEGIYMVSTSDIGMRFDIHPKNKRPVGERLAKMAEGNIYGFPILAEAPEAVAVQAVERGFEITFSRVGDGLTVAGESINALTIEGPDGKTAEIDSFAIRKDCLYVSVKQCSSGQYRILYAQTPYYEVNLFNSAGIPAIPFLLTAEKTAGDNGADRPVCDA